MGNGSGKELKAVVPFPDSERPQSSSRPSSASTQSIGHPPSDIPKNPAISDTFNSTLSNHTYKTYDDEVRPPSGNSGIRNRQQNFPEDSSEGSKSDTGVPNANIQHSFDFTGFDFQITEGQSRRNMLAYCDTECSMITEFLFVSGSKVKINMNGVFYFFRS
jgi:hypothetical protein